MSRKRKRKHNNLTDLFFDSLFWVKQYEAQTSLPIEVVIDNLKSLTDAIEMELILTDSYYDVDIQADSDTEYTFTIHMIHILKDQRRDTFVTATGVIYVDPDNMTIIEGDIRFTFWMALFVPMLLGMVVLMFQTVAWFSIIFAAVPIAVLLAMFQRRNQLLRRIQDAITTPQKSKLKNDLQAHEEDDLEIETDAEENQTQAQ